MATETQSNPSERLFFLDWLRILAFAALVLYHVGMYYVSWDFHVKSPFSSKTFEPWMKLTEPWRMSLIFMISGAATALMLKHAASIELAKSRTRFLLLPLLCGVLLIVPPQSYFEVVQKFKFQGSFIDFLALYFKGYHGFCALQNTKQCLILPTWNHLWFLPYLWAYTMIIFFVTKVWPNCLQIIAARLDQSANAVALFVAPILFIFIIRLLLQARFPATHALIDDWYNHANYLSMFFIGAVGAASKLTWLKLATLRWLALAVAIICWSLVVFADIDRPLQYLVIASFQWSAICAAFGFAKHFLNHDFRPRALLTEAVFPVYILHQTIIIVASQWLLPFRLIPAIEGPLLVLLAFSLSFTLYVGIKRISALHSWFGIKRR